KFLLTKKLLKKNSLSTYKQKRNLTPILISLLLPKKTNGKQSVLSSGQLTILVIRKNFQRRQKLLTGFLNCTPLLSISWKPEPVSVRTVEIQMPYFVAIWEYIFQRIYRNVVLRWGMNSRVGKKESFLFFVTLNDTKPGI